MREQSSSLPLLKEKDKEVKGPVTFRLPPDVLTTLEAELQQAIPETEADPAYDLPCVVVTKIFKVISFTRLSVLTENVTALPLVAAEQSSKAYMAHLRQGLVKLEKGLFAAALEHIIAAISALGTPLPLSRQFFLSLGWSSDVPLSRGAR